VSRLALYLELGRVSNLPTVWTNVLAGVVLAGARPRVATVAFLAFTLSLFYVGGMFLNDAFDRAADARQRPERPIPSGRITAGEVFAVGCGLVAAGVALAAWHAPRLGAVAAAVALAAAIVLYDAWHKENPFGPALMGLCRLLVYVTAALAVSPTLNAPVVVGALCLFAYLIGLTYAAKQETLAHLRHLWPLAFLVVPLVHGLWAAPDGIVGALVYLALLTCVLTAVRLLRGSERDRFPRAVTALIAAISLVDALAIAGAGAPGTALIASLGWPATLALQRWVRGT
jgi:4-hydroxybenzoate polyprenyltransferase